MQKNIRLHVADDEERQAQLDESLAKLILETHKKNINSFERNIPDLAAKIRKPSLQNVSLFCNKFGNVNIVDYGTGRTFYGFDPESEVKAQVQAFSAHSPKVSLTHQNKTQDNANSNEDCMSLKGCPGYKRYKSFEPAPSTIDCLVVLGCGLGLHIIELLKTYKIRNLIVYEPEIQYFLCSALATKWYEIFELSKLHGTNIFIQNEKDGREIIAHINELTKVDRNVEEFYLYQHYNHHVFDNLSKELTTKSWKSLNQLGISFKQQDSYLEAVPYWTGNIPVSEYADCSRQSERFLSNLDAFKKFFPDIHKEFADYTPTVWLPIKNNAGEVNLIKADSLTPWYSDTPVDDCLQHYQSYSKHPNRDGLVLGYDGEKLAHYLHYEFVKKTEKLVDEAKDDIGVLPEKIASIIVFGIGAGYQIEHLVDEHSVEKLFICEPNRDFFYASLFAIDWAAILEKLETHEARLYLNIGDDGTHLFNDLLSQFHSIGPYILNSTYFYQSYYNSALNVAIAQLREQLQIVISMGEYFDHAYYGITHSREVLRRNTPALAAAPATKLTYEDREVPVFIIGNGPSLDLSIEAIKEWQDKAIIVSCGTALQALYKNGITPDFHAEIEQNRSTHDWAVMVGDLDYLKKITLLSCNGIHPDTCSLYKNVLIAFKEGESSTVSALKVLGKSHFEVLEHSFPTVSNFVTDLIFTIGFNHVYFMGVDLGFIDASHHHSKYSGYYQENGEETYDYSKKNNTSLVVPGNFRPHVHTKYEFKVSRQVIEQVVNKRSKQQSVYNCSDGAKIQGAQPLDINNLLIVSSASDKQRVIQKMQSTVFSQQYNDNFIARFDQKFSRDQLIDDLDKFKQLLTKNVTSDDDATDLINSQKELLFSSYQSGNSLLFYYLYGTSNYASALLTKLVHSDIDDKYESGLFAQTLDLWRDLMEKISVLLSRKIELFDTSFFKVHEREVRLIKPYVENKSLLIITDSCHCVEGSNWLLDNYFKWNLSVTFCTPDMLAQEASNSFDFVIYNLKFQAHTTKPNVSLTGAETTCFCLYGKALERYENLSAEYPFITFVPFLEESSSSGWMSDQVTVAAMLINVAAQGHNSRLVLPKYKVSESLDTEHFSGGLYSPKDDEIVFEYPLFLAVYPESHSTADDSLNNGTRGTAIIDKLTADDFIQERIDPEGFSARVQKFRGFIETDEDDHEIKKLKTLRHHRL